jgi:hypothetical protein
MTSWELKRNWDIVRYLVYYLIENLVPPELIPDKDIIDFSAGMGDLSEYLIANKPNSLTATSPDDVSPENLNSKPGFKFISNLPAQTMSQKLLLGSADLFVARMVFQFPTDHRDNVDVDGMLSQIYKILRPGGELIICSHEFTQLSDAPHDWDMPLDDYLKHVTSHFTGKQKEQVSGLVEMIRTIGLPPREGVHGQTGFGLKGFMAIDSFIQAGFTIKTVSEIEDFTYPVGIRDDFSSRRDYYKDLSQKVFAIKQKYISTAQYQDKYTRPGVLKSIFRELNQLHHFVSVPIFKIHAIK